MFVDSLLNLSVKAVAKCFCEARYEHIDFSLNEPISDLVFNEVAKAENEVSNFRSIVSSIISKQSGLKLNLTKFNSNSRFAYRFDMEHLHLHDIRSLDINLYCFKKNREFIIGYRDEVLILDAEIREKMLVNELKVTG
uniref:FTH domain-containing protein n=1 Tax=Caenorhabditis tropicalis TaxID=1561998 RepID=A0A1I7TVK9_9PELO